MRRSGNWRRASVVFIPLSCHEMQVIDQKFPSSIIVPSLSMLASLQEPIEVPSVRPRPVLRPHPSLQFASARAAAKRKTKHPQEFGELLVDNFATGSSSAAGVP